MTVRSFACCALFLLAACGGVDSDRIVDLPGDTALLSVAGDYSLATVDDRTPPCCAIVDSAGVAATVLGATLKLGAAPSEEWTFTPVGMLPRSCVTQIPEGAVVDTARVVHMPDGSSYKLPECGAGPYALVRTIRYDRPDGSSATVTDTASGKYAWGAGYIVLVGKGTTPGRRGDIRAGAGAIGITIERATVGPPIRPPFEPTLGFVRTAEAEAKARARARA